MGQDLDLKKSSVDVLATTAWNPTLLSPTRDAQDPNLNLPAKKVSIKLVVSEAETDCHFWIGLSRKGTINPSKLLDLNPIAELFHKAAQEGISEPGPVMLSDSQKSPARFIYLLPPPQADRLAEEKWMQQLLTTIHSWAPPCTGFYLAPELLEPKVSLGLLNEILARLIVSHESQHFYLLLGSHGLSSVLNSTLRLKADLLANNVDLLVFH